MQKLFLFTISILYSCFALAKSSYQVDLILFAHPQSAGKSSEQAMMSPLIPMSKDSITLKSDSNSSYALLKPSQSSLHDENYLLSRKSHFQVLGNYSWKQPGTNKSNVTLPNTNHNGWLIQGVVRVLQSNYYSFDADIQLSPPNNPQSSFTVKQKQRLKGDIVYFLDHPKIGMLVKIHKLS